MSRVTLRLPGDLHERLRDVSHRTGASLNQVIVATLRGALANDAADEPATPLLQQARLARIALADLTVDVAPSWFATECNPGEKVPTHEELLQALPSLTPSLSATVIAEREDRV